MEQVTVESALGEKLGALTSPALVRDSSGRALGYFSPLSPEAEFGEFDLEPPMSIAETEELRKVKTGKPLEEILSRLGLS